MRKALTLALLAALVCSLGGCVDILVEGVKTARYSKPGAEQREVTNARWGCEEHGYGVWFDRSTKTRAEVDACMERYGYTVNR